MFLYNAMLYTIIFAPPSSTIYPVLVLVTV